MSFLRRFLSKAKAGRSSLKNTHNAGRDPERLPDETESSLSEMLGDAIYIYYRIYAEDGAIPSKTSAAPGFFLGCIKARSVPPPHTARTLIRTIANVEGIRDPLRTLLFLTPYSQAPMGGADKVNILNRNGPGSTPQEPLAFVDCGRVIYKYETLCDEEPEESRGKDEVGADFNTTPPPDIRYLYYLLYVNNCETPSKVAINPEEPFLGRIRADSVTPPHSPATIIRCISKAERSTTLAQASLFADISCDTPLKSGPISILHSDCPGLSPMKPMAIVLDFLDSTPDHPYTTMPRQVLRQSRYPAPISKLGKTLSSNVNSQYHISLA